MSVTSTSVRATTHKTESDIRLLLAAGKNEHLPKAGRDTDLTPKELRTPESYLGYLRIGNYTGSPLQHRPDGGVHASRRR